MNLSKVSTLELAGELRSRGLAVIVWQPEDMEGYGDPAVSLEDRLGECRKSLEDRSVEHGWEVISCILGDKADDEEED